MRKLLFVIVLFFSLVMRVEGGRQISLSLLTIPPLEPTWVDLTGKMPEGISQAFFLVAKNQSCLVIFATELNGEVVRFSTSRIGSGKDVVISERNGRVSYRNGANNALVKASDPTFKYCADKVKKAEEFTPELKARFHRFAGIK